MIPNTLQEDRQKQLNEDGKNKNHQNQRNPDIIL